MPTTPTGATLSDRLLTDEHIDEEDWRYSPLSSERIADYLTPARLAQLLRAADMGDTRAYLTLAEELERRDLHYRAVITQRKSAVSQLTPEVVPASKSARNERVAREVRQLFGAPEFRRLIFDLLDAISKGYSVVEILWETTERQWRPREYRWRRPQLFRVHPVSLRGYRLDDYTYEGKPLPPYKFAIHEANLISGPAVQGGLARVCMGAYLAKSYTVRDLMRFLEVYGIPARIGRYPENAPKEYRKKLFAMVKKIGTDAAAVLPENMIVEFLEHQKSGDTDGFLRTVDYWNREISKVGVGQTSSIDGKAGGSYKADMHHKGVRLDIAAHDALHAASTVARDIVAPFVGFNFGWETPLPEIRLTVPQPENVLAWMQAVGLAVDRGHRVAAREVDEKLGVTPPVDDEAVLEPAAMPSMPAPSPPGEQDGADQGEPEGDGE